MRYRYLTCDVFTERRFGGNQLAVLPDAVGLSTEQMQRIAAEFNYSETTFVLPPAEATHLARVRIFTPRSEMPFAGHPTVGTALVLAWLDRVPPGGEIVLEEQAGPVPVHVALVDGRPGTAEFAAPVAPTSGKPQLAASLGIGLSVEEIVTAGGLPCVASCGAPFLLVEVAGLDALGRARLDATVALPDGAKGVFLFTRETGAAALDVRARMFAPHDGIAEDPATGSAAAAFAGYLAGLPDVAEGWHRWRIGQGFEMGRPSLIEARARREANRVVEVRVGGAAVPVAEGSIEVDA